MEPPPTPVDPPAPVEPPVLPPVTPEPGQAPQLLRVLDLGTTGPYITTKKGVFAGLKGVQFVKDGDAFGGGAPAAATEFDVVEGADAADFA